VAPCATAGTLTENICTSRRASTGHPSRRRDPPGDSLTESAEGRRRRIGGRVLAAPVSVASAAGIGWFAARATGAPPGGDGARRVRFRGGRSGVAPRPGGTTKWRPWPLAQPHGRRASERLSSWSAREASCARPRGMVDRVVLTDPTAASCSPTTPSENSTRSFREGRRPLETGGACRRCQRRSSRHLEADEPGHPGDRPRRRPGQGDSGSLARSARRGDRWGRGGVHEVTGAEEAGKSETGVRRTVARASHAVTAIKGYAETLRDGGLRILKGPPNS